MGRAAVAERMANKMSCRHDHCSKVDLSDAFQVKHMSALQPPEFLVLYKPT